MNTKVENLTKKRGKTESVRNYGLFKKWVERSLETPQSMPQFHKWMFPDKNAKNYVSIDALRQIVWRYRWTDRLELFRTSETEKKQKELARIEIESEKEFSRSETLMIQSVIR